MTVSGIFTTDASQAGAIIIAIDPATAKEQANKQSDDPDKTALISVYGNKTTPLDDNAQQQLADRINKALRDRRRRMPSPVMNTVTNQPNPRRTRSASSNRLF